MRVFLACFLACLVVIVHKMASAAEIKLAFIAGSIANGEDVFVMTANDTIQRLSSDRRVKSLPLLSPSGRYIVWQELGLSDSVSDLVVADVDGQVKAHILIEPTAGTQYAEPLREVDQITWLSDSKIAVEGSADPSTCRYLVYESRLNEPSDKPREITDASADFLDQNGREAASCAARFSPDGKHFAAVETLPHFSSEDSPTPAYADQTPTVTIDYAEVKTRLGYSYIMTPFSWSEADTLGYVARRLPSNHDVIVTVAAAPVIHVGDTYRFAFEPAISKIDLGVTRTDDLRMRWSGGTIIVDAFASGRHMRSWAATPTAGSRYALSPAHEDDPPTTNRFSLADAKGLRESLVKRMHADITQIDVFTKGDGQVRSFPNIETPVPYHVDMH